MPSNLYCWAEYRSSGDVFGHCAAVGNSMASGLVIKILLCLVVVYLIHDILSTSTQGEPLYLETDW